MNKELQEVFQVRGNAIYSVTDDTTIKNAVDKMNIHNIGALMVLTENGEVAGILSERDVMIKLAATDGLVGHLLVKEIMTKRENLIVIEGDETVAEIMGIMTSKKIRHLPIVDTKGVLQGVISMRDVFSILLKDANQDIKDMKNYVMSNYPL
ncbi:MAG: CBS domain-containing protein [Candidatus Cloacimonadaceae bacterium]|nr:CBS domain-containing protein [Candidatus Cloacimonadaceae bacterium]MDP3113419.1 CBS domain-containing protein [Candidatus Cloacimonadaceae bacterium]